MREKLGFWLMQLNEAASFCTSRFIEFIYFISSPCWQFVLHKQGMLLNISYPSHQFCGLGAILPYRLEVQLLLEGQEAPADRVGEGCLLLHKI